MNTKKKILFIGALTVLGVFALLMAGQCCEQVHHVMPQIFAASGGGLLLAGTVAAPAVLPEAEFQAKVLGGMEAHTKSQGEFKSAVQKVQDDLDRADKEVKKAIDEMTKVKNTCNDQAELMAKMEKAQKLIVLNAPAQFR